MTKEIQQPTKFIDNSTKILDSYKKEFIDECQLIIELKEADFLRHFFKKMNMILLEEYGQEAYDDINFTQTIKEVEQKIYSTLYTPMRINCQNAMMKYTKFDQLKKDDSIFLTNFRPHCNNNKIPIHTCKSRFIPVYDSKGKTVYVVCVGCRHCFFESSILMYCSSCNQHSYSSVLSGNDTQLYPATWEKYHCNAVMNEKMHCIRCQDVFYLKNDYLFCKNCKFMVQPLDVIWRCLICVKEFKSHAKIYNPLEFKVFKLSIKNALLYKVILKPNDLPCKCDMNPLTLEFNHKTSCKGVLYHGKLNNHHIVVCSLCKAMATLNKFQWKCPICAQVFITANVKVITQEENKALLMERNKVVNNQGSDKKYIQEALSYIKNGPIDSSIAAKANVPNINFDKVSKLRTAISIPRNLSNSNRSKDQQPMQRRNYSTNYKESDLHNKKFNTLDYDDPYYSNNQVHMHKKNDTNIKLHLDNDKSPLVTEKNIKTDSNINEKSKPAMKGNYKNFYGNIPQKIINLDISREAERSNNASLKNDDKTNPLTLSAEMYNKVKRFSNSNSQNLLNSLARSPIAALRRSERILKQSGTNDSNNDIKDYKNISLSKSLSKEQIISIKEEEVVKKSFLSKSQICFQKDMNPNPCDSPLKKNRLNFVGDISKDDIIIKTPDKEEKEKERPEIKDNKKSTCEVEDDRDKEPTMEIINSEDYTIITQLGQGTFGKIYLVQDKQQNIFSLKKIILTEELDIESILKEYQLCYRLQHDNIIKIIGYQQTKLDFNTYAIYILMEVGLSDWEKEIKTHIDKKQNYTEKELINILFQLVSALSFLQRKNVSHRDIKPHNVLKFKKNVYKLADFGEAKQLQKSGMNNGVSTLRGTELYMSPLLFNGLKTNQLDIKHNLCKSDVFSLGLCFVYAMTLSTSHIYEIRKIVDSKTLRTFLKSLIKAKYSTKLLDLIGDMLEINEKNRMNFIELEEKISSLFLRD